MTSLKYFRDHNNGDIEVIVSDNASSDETRERVTQFIRQNKLDNFTYERNEINIGPDANFKKALSMATGVYAFLLGDDDFLNDPFLQDLLEQLRALERPVSFLTVLAPRGKAGEGKLDLFSIENMRDYLVTIGPQITFMSSMVFNTEAVQRVLRQELKYEPNLFQSFLQVAAIRSASDAPFGVFYAHAFSFNGEPTATNYSFYEVFVTRVVSLYRTALPDSSEVEVRCAYKEAFMHYLMKFTILLKALGQNPKFEKSAYEILRHFPVSWCVLMPLFLVPGWIYRPMYRVYKGIKDARRREKN